MTALRTAVTSLLFSLLTASAALAGPPLITDDAGTVESGRFEIELNGSYAYDKEDSEGITSKSNTTDGELKVTTGLAGDLGISLALPYTFSTRDKENNALAGKDDGFGDLTLELKYTFAELAGTHLAIKPVLILPTGKDELSDDHLQYATTLIASRDFADGAFALHANLGYEYHSYKSVADAGRRSFWSASLAGEAEVVKGLFTVADFGLATNPDKTSNTLPVYALTGVRFKLNDTLDINVGIKLGLTNPETNITALYGLVLKL